MYQLSKRVTQRHINIYAKSELNKLVVNLIGTIIDIAVDTRKPGYAEPPDGRIVQLILKEKKNERISLDLCDIHLHIEHVC